MNTKFTTKSQEALAAALQNAAASGHPKLEPAHLLIALLEQPGGVAPALLQALGSNPEAVIQRGRALLAALPTASGSAVANPDASRATHTVLAKAGEEAQALGDEYVSTEHLLIGLTQDSQTGAALSDQGATRQALVDALPRVRGNAKVTSADPEGTYNALEQYGTDLTEAAREGKIDPIIGRDSEIRRVVQVLSRRTKNNP
ncbi:MAG TPA: Clp protease N-terminal domain-containing protein, partial [Beutenbergiaceae bacterium]|nr:Clp protease N-terminal domain-containing protein [Beutenbergiaceae bacterium]